MKRVFNEAEPELMDRPQPVSAELETNLDNLRKLNQHFGSYYLIRCFLRKWLMPGRCYRLLDLATGSADIPRMIVDWTRRKDISVRVDAVDFHPATLEIAKNRCADYPEISLLRGDARTFETQVTYDVVLCSLALHHFSDVDAVRVLRRAADLSLDKVLVSDLERSWLTWACVWAVTALLYREPMTRNDGRVSVRRSFSFGEMAELADAAGWQGYGHRRFLPARQAIWTSVNDDTPAVELPASALDYAT